MKRISLIGLGMLAVALGTAGCSSIPFIGKRKHPSNSGPDRVSSHVATDTERDFMDRWIAKRSGELVAQGQSPDAANEQAMAEFRQTFAATTIVSGQK
jgi:hypothetical protein